MTLSRTTVVWAALCLITVLSYWLAPGHSGGTAGASTAITVAVIALVAVKVRLVIRYFMEVATAPRWLRWATDGWVVVLTAAVLVAYLS